MKIPDIWRQSRYPNSLQLFKQLQLVAPNMYQRQAVPAVSALIPDPQNHHGYDRSLDYGDGFTGVYICVHIKLCPLTICSVLCINYTSIKL